METGKRTGGALPENVQREILDILRRGGEACVKRVRSQIHVIEVRRELRCKEEI